MDDSGQFRLEMGCLQTNCEGMSGDQLGMKSCEGPPSFSAESKIRNVLNTLLGETAAAEGRSKVESAASI